MPTRSTCFSTSSSSTTPTERPARPSAPFNTCTILGQRLWPMGQPLRPMGQRRWPMGQRLRSMGQRLRPMGQHLWPMRQRLRPTGQLLHPQQLGSKRLQQKRKLHHLYPQRKLHHLCPQRRYRPEPESAKGKTSQGALHFWPTNRGAGWRLTSWCGRTPATWRWCQGRSRSRRTVGRSLWEVAVGAIRTTVTSRPSMAAVLVTCRNRT
mmetsp:Transcript_1368/g.2591  ORF Transcript_1368/g.2591 Transcript_1368/m.2591 type:complete len:208 (-) Transcript_1368:67-690(-)